MMLLKIELFIFILSWLFCIKNLIQFVVALTQSDPVPIKLGIIEKVLLYCSIAYILTFIITI